MDILNINCHEKQNKLQLGVDGPMPRHYQFSSHKACLLSCHIHGHTMQLSCKGGPKENHKTDARHCYPGRFPLQYRIYLLHLLILCYPQRVCPPFWDNASCIPGVMAGQTAILPCMSSYNGQSFSPLCKCTQYACGDWRMERATHNKPNNEPGGNKNKCLA